MHMQVIEAPDIRWPGPTTADVGEENDEGSDPSGPGLLNFSVEKYFDIGGRLVYRGCIKKIR